MKSRLGNLLLIVIFGHTFNAAAQSSGAFTPTGNMTIPRYRHMATLLLNRKVLITPGSGDRSASADLYDPSNGTFTATANMTTTRSEPSATLLADGRVLIAGGDNLGTAELYDPDTGTFTATGNMVTTQDGHRATLLNNGKVLIAGGGRWCPIDNDGCAIYDRPELYDPVSGAFTAAGDGADRSGGLFAGLAGAPATLLPNGKVLIAAEPTAELYDPQTGTFELTGQMTRGRFGGQQPGWAIGGTATLLPNGQVLLAGGNFLDFGYLAEAELYDPSTGKFAAIGNLIAKATDGQTATLLPDGTVLIAGGDGWDAIAGHCCTGGRPGAELYDPSSGAFKSISGMNVGRSWHAATPLNDGRVLITGGVRFSGSVAFAELYVPSIVAPVPGVTAIQFDRTTVIAGTSYSVNVSGSNLTPQTFFDVRFAAPGSNASDVVLNWQRGLSASHPIPIGIESGPWTINGVRAHEIETDHTGSFMPVVATITVSP